MATPSRARATATCATAAVAVYDLESDTLLGETTWLARRRQTQDLLAAARVLSVLLPFAVIAAVAVLILCGALVIRKIINIDV